MHDISIYCILCPSYHGATLLSLVLGNHSRVLSLGDTVAASPSQRCGCGKLVGECEFWRSVRARWGGVTNQEFIPARPKILPWPRLNQAASLCSAVIAFRAGAVIRFDPLARAFEAQLDVCRELTDFDVLIDGYKSLSRYAALKAAGFPIRGAIHLLRDPRSFVASSKVRSISVAHAAREWSRIHRAITRITDLMGERVFQVRYNELCAAPKEQLANIQSWMHLHTEPILRPLDADRHWVGNKSMRHFTGEIRPRDDWQTRLTKAEVSCVEALTASEALRFGYDLSRETGK